MFRLVLIVKVFGCCARFFTKTIRQDCPQGFSPDHFLFCRIIYAPDFQSHGVNFPVQPGKEDYGEYSLTSS
ncbi:MAG: hypothetical protein WC379_04595 [Methanoregula sp.]|jgi:hypothetical protein